MKIQKARQLIWGYKNLQKIAKSLQRSHENACNYGLTKRQETRKANLMKKAQEIAKRLGFKAYEQGDPRGCSLYLIDNTCKEYTDGIAIF